MKLIYKLFKQDPESRDGIITVTSSTNIVANVLIAVVKVIVGLLASSISIIAEGANNASDALTSILTLIGSKLAKKHPDKKHPFGYGRIEYLTSLVVSVLILVTGIEMLISSVKLIFNPEELKINYISIIIVGISAIIKFILSAYTIKMGKKAGSSALKAVGLESRSDCIVSVVTIVAAVIFIVFDFSVDAYAGAVTSLFIIKAGGEVLFETISELIGRPGSKELAAEIYDLVRHTDGVLSAADMMLHNYGPDAWSGSVNIEIDHEKNVGDVYSTIHALQLEIMHKYHVTMVFGIYAVDNDHEDSKILRKYIGSYVVKKEFIKSFHAVYIDPENSKIYVDFIVDYKLKDWDETRTDFLKFMSEKYPDMNIELTIETEYV